MLDTTLTTEFVPGTNVKGNVAGANWLFLLPTLELGHVLCVGSVAEASLLSLARIADEVTVLTFAPAAAQKVRNIIQTHQLRNVRCQNSTADLPNHSIDLMILDDTRARYVARDNALCMDLQRVLDRHGLIYFETKGAFEGAELSQAFPQFTAISQRYWLTPLGGEMHTAVPVQDTLTKAYFVHHGLLSRSFNLSMLKRRFQAKVSSQSLARSTVYTAPSVASGGATRRDLKRRAKRSARTTLASLFNRIQDIVDSTEQRIGSSALLGSSINRLGVLAGGNNLSEQPPHYLCEIARRVGVTIDSHRWGLSARGEYSSRKVLVFLFNKVDEQPEYIVKMTRDPALNPRLENEYHALTLLEKRGIGDRETLPRVAFFGHHRRLAILGETIVDGMPFEQQASGAANCPQALDAIAWLTELGIRTAERSTATPLDVAEGLGVLLKRFAEIYNPTQTLLGFLEAQVATIASSRETLPLVFQHGDPGTWNALITPSNRTAFLDWEAAEPNGLPLWDLFYFVRTYGAWSLRSAISGDVTKGFVGQFLEASPFQALLADATARYCDKVGVPKQFVEPLFYTCWMHRALKEATRLPENMLGRGHYANVLRVSMERHDVIQNLFSR